MLVFFCLSLNSCTLLWERSLSSPLSTPEESDCACKKVKKCGRHICMYPGPKGYWFISSYSSPLPTRVTRPQRPRWPFLSLTPSPNRAGTPCAFSRSPWRSSLTHLPESLLLKYKKRLIVVVDQKRCLRRPISKGLTAALEQVTVKQREI